MKLMKTVKITLSQGLKLHHRFCKILRTYPICLNYCKVLSRATTPPESSQTTFNKHKMA